MNECGTVTVVKLFK